MKKGNKLVANRQGVLSAVGAKRRSRPVPFYRENLPTGGGREVLSAVGAKRRSRPVPIYRENPPTGGGREVLSAELSY